MDQHDGFVLTRGWRDASDGIELTYWLATTEGPLLVRYRRQRAVMFVERDARATADERRPLELTNLQHAPVDALYFSSRKRLLDTRDALRASGIPVFESDIKPSERFLMERFVTGGCRVRGVARARAGYLEMDEPRMTACEVRPHIRCMSIDIETEGFDGRLLSIAAVDDDSERVFMRGEGAPSALIQYCSDDRSLLRAFFRFVAERDPDALIGWNVVEFDLAYLQRLCETLGVPFSLGRGSKRARVLMPQTEGQLPMARIPGRVALDGIALLKTATLSFERFTLEHVAQTLLGRGKRIHTPDDRVDEIVRLFREDKTALAEYNVEDCRLVRDIFERAKLVSFAIERQRMTGLPMDRAGGAVAAFDNLYLPRLHRAGFVANDVGLGRGGLTSPGGYVLPSVPGLYDHVLVLDYKSLYPSIIRTFRIDPLGLAIGGENGIEGFDGAVFSRDRHILPTLIEELWGNRDRAKRQRDEALSRAIKILMNSFYGVLGTPGCRFCRHQLTSSITRRGHEIITRSRDWIEARGWRVIYGDTDSVFVLIGTAAPDECIAIGRQLVDDLNGWWRERVAAEHGVESRLELELDAHYHRFFMPTLRGSEIGSAKRYAGLVYDDGPRVVVKGLEAVRTDWTPVARDFQREVLRRVFLGEPVEEYVREVRRRLLAGELDDQLVYRKRLRRELDEYAGNVPPHVRAARALDRPLREVEYVWTLDGPQPVTKQTSRLDHRHYLEKQLAPAADGILQCLGTSFEQVAGDQLGLFG